MAGKVHVVTDQSFEAEILRSAEPALVDFWAVWCGPCRMIAPIVEDLSGEYDGRVKFTKMNVDENIQTPGRYGIRGIPTLLLFKDGKLVDQIVGIETKANIKKVIDRHV